jgi:hypothetical protein
MKNEKTLGSIAIAKVNAVLEPAWRSVVPIFRVGDVHEPEAFGSAVLIELAGQRFLVTARHVVDEHLKSRIHTVGASGYVVITGDFFCASESGLDVAVLRLEGDLKDELADHVFLTEADILPADQYDGVNLVALISRQPVQGKPPDQEGANSLLFGGCQCLVAFRRNPAWVLPQKALPGWPVRIEGDGARSAWNERRRDVCRQSQAGQCRQGS